METHRSRLTPDEQLTHLTLWSMLAAPLILGCDLSQMDPFTLALLTNDEVLDIDQDPLGRQASRKWQSGTLEAWARPLGDGSTAVALFNRGIDPARVAPNWSDLGMSDAQSVRDLWRRKDLGTIAGKFETLVPAHGAVLIKAARSRR